MRVKYDKACLASAVEAAIKLVKAGNDGGRIVYATACGFVIRRECMPPGNQSHVVVYPDGSTMAFAYDFRAGVWECSKPEIEAPAISGNLLDVLRRDKAIAPGRAAMRATLMVALLAAPHSPIVL